MKLRRENVFKENVTFLVLEKKMKFGLRGICAREFMHSLRPEKWLCYIVIYTMLQEMLCTTNITKDMLNISREIFRIKVTKKERNIREAILLKIYFMKKFRKGGGWGSTRSNLYFFKTQNGPFYAWISLKYQ